MSESIEMVDVTATVHVTNVEEQGPRSWYAHCTCGWCGKLRWLEETARNDMTAHFQYLERKMADRQGPMPESAAMSAEVRDPLKDVSIDAANTPDEIDYTFLHKNMTDQQLVKLIGIVAVPEGFEVTFPERAGMDCIVNWRNWKRYDIKADGTVVITGLRSPS